jgi:hypothetical protein
VTREVTRSGLSPAATLCDNEHHKGIVQAKETGNEAILYCVTPGDGGGLLHRDGHAR